MPEPTWSTLLQDYWSSQSILCLWEDGWWILPDLLPVLKQMTRSIVCLEKQCEITPDRNFSQQRLVHRNIDSSLRQNWEKLFIPDRLMKVWTESRETAPRKPSKKDINCLGVGTCLRQLGNVHDLYTHVWPAEPLHVSVFFDLQAETISWLYLTRLMNLHTAVESIR